MLQYRSFSHRTKGAAHRVEELCQDYADHYQDDRMAIAVVADGHGSPQYFRSDIGARIATEVAMKSIKEYIFCNNERPDIFIDKDGDYASRNGQKPFDRLAGNIIAEWLNEVSADEQTAPISFDERLATIDEKYRVKYLNDKSHHYFAHAYGTTLIAVAVTELYWFGLHIGDGRCEVLLNDGEWVQPIPWDDKCFLNSTTSICDDDAMERTRFWYGPMEKDLRFPVALFVNSDGIDDSYSVDEEVKQKQLASLYRSVVLSFAKDGFESTNAKLPEMIKRFATNGSRDDVSISGIIHTGLPEDFVDYMVVQDETEKAIEKVNEEQKKAELRAQTLQTAHAKAEQATKKSTETQRMIQELEQEIGRANTFLTNQHDSIIKATRAIEKAKQELKCAEVEHIKVQSDLQSAIFEVNEAKRKVVSAKADHTIAENSVFRHEDAVRLLEAKQTRMRSRLELLFDPSTHRFEQNSLWLNPTTPDEVSVLVSDNMISNQNHDDHGNK